MEIALVQWPEEVRDYVIIVSGSVGVIVFAVMLFFTLVIGVLVTSLVLKTRSVMRENVQPALENVKATTSTVRTTATLLSEYAINPLAKAYGTYQGARRFVTVLTRFRGKGG